MLKLVQDALALSSTNRHRMDILFPDVRLDYPQPPAHSTTVGSRTSGILVGGTQYVCFLDTHPQPVPDLVSSV